jgi:hypothetical protein
LRRLEGLSMRTMTLAYATLIVAGLIYFAVLAALAR